MCITFITQYRKYRKRIMREPTLNAVKLYSLSLSLSLSKDAFVFKEHCEKSKNRMHSFINNKNCKEQCIYWKENEKSLREFLTYTLYHRKYREYLFDFESTLTTTAVAQSVRACASHVVYMSFRLFRGKQKFFVACM